MLILERFLARLNGKPKAADEAPNLDPLTPLHRALGDLLLEQHLILPAELSQALERQRRENKRPLLGQILVGSGLLSEDELAITLALQARSKDGAKGPIAVETKLYLEPPPGSKAPAEEVEGPMLPAWFMQGPYVPGAEPNAAATETLPIFADIPEHVLEESPGTYWLPAASGPKLVSTPETSSSQPIHSGPAPVVPITRFSRTATDARRFPVLHHGESKWRAPFPSRRILIAVGTQSQAIKLAPLVRELRGRIAMPGAEEQVLVCVTGGPREKVAEALETFGVSVDVNLELTTEDQRLSQLSAGVLTAFSQVIADFEPDWVVVQGDTAATSMAALAAFYAKVRVAQVEAGLSTKDLQQPFPDEFNRRMVEIFATIHFAPTDWAKNNLLREGVAAEDILVTGNTRIDALHHSCDRLRLQPGQHRGPHSGPVRVLVATQPGEDLHEEVEDVIANLCAAIANLVTKDPGRYTFLWPLNSRPHVDEVVRTNLAGFGDIQLMPPATYDDLLMYLDQADLVLTTSGELQEEAPSFGKPVLIMLEKTDRPEGVRAGLAWLVGTERERLQAAIAQLGQQIAEQRKLRSSENPYGDGHASERIADFFAGRPVQEFGTQDREYAGEQGAREAPDRLQTVS